MRLYLCFKSSFYELLDKRSQDSVLAAYLLAGKKFFGAQKAPKLSFQYLPFCTLLGVALNHNIPDSRIVDGHPLGRMIVVDESSK